MVKHCKHNLLHVVLRTHPPRSFPSRLHSRQKQADQNTYGRNGIGDSPVHNNLVPDDVPQIRCCQESFHSLDVLQGCRFHFLRHLTIVLNLLVDHRFGEYKAVLS